MDTMIINNFSELMGRGLEIVYHPLPYKYIKMEQDYLYIFKDTLKHTYCIKDLQIIRYNIYYNTICLIFKNADTVVLRLPKRRGAGLFYKYFMMLLEYKYIPITLQTMF